MLIHLCIAAQTYMYIYICVCVWVCVYTLSLTHTYTHTHTHAHIYIYIYIYIWQKPKLVCKVRLTVFSIVIDWLIDFNGISTPLGFSCVDVTELCALHPYVYIYSLVSRNGFINFNDWVILCLHFRDLRTLHVFIHFFVQWFNLFSNTSLWYQGFLYIPNNSRR